MTYRWDWSVLVSEPYLGWLLAGLGWTLLVAGAAWVLALAVGVTIGVLRTLPNRAARTFGTAYVETFRNIPLLLQLFVWYFVLPELLPAPIGNWIKRDLPLPEYWTAVIGLGLFTAARVAEQTRAGIQAIGRGQAMAAAASGLTLTQSYRYILLPIAARNVLPPLTSEFLNVVKNSSLALTIGLLELTGQSRQIESATFHGIEAFTAATLTYVVLTTVVIVALRAIERLVAIPGLMARA
ncbi:amino acid ABC transporter permease [Bradyrhizobium sp. BR 10289]|uniref:amino acid ABC transporter permease n=1 Tax=Bradyrhizobium sp. BR 10289 TaxID=2749993 RepID=UPI001C647F8E|nr:amino acid ABC transporter permease [Bradyrhizobium sp. BR 10289]MBW7970560.1 amino acid ABC transporter permease [Bradyrhizobium sp. BR 10289]